MGKKRPKYKKQKAAEQLYDISYSEVLNAIEFQKPDAEFSTDHGVKGEEYLVLHKKPVDVAVVARDLWPDEELSQVRNNNRQAIFRIHSEMLITTMRRSLTRVPVHMCWRTKFI